MRNSSGLPEGDGSSINVVGGSGDEGGFGRAEEEGEVGDFFGRGHATDGLEFTKFFEHFLFVIGVVGFEVVVNEGGVDATGADTVTADVFIDEVFRNTAGHGHDGTFTGGVDEAVGECDFCGDGCHVQDDASALIDHGLNGGVDGVINAFCINVHDAVVICFGGVSGVSDVGDAGVINEDIEALMFFENG